MSEIKPRAYYIGALNAFTTSKDEAEKMGKQFPVEALYPAAAYEALQARIKELEIAAKYAEHIDATPESQRETMLYDTLMERDVLKAENEALRKELDEFEAERNRRDEMRKALEAQMGISNKWQS